MPEAGAKGSSTHMPDHDPLEAYLRRRSNDDIELSFTEIEAIIGAQLPEGASRPRWWASANTAGKGPERTKAWDQAGYQAFLLPGRRVLFSPTGHGPNCER